MFTDHAAHQPSWPPRMTQPRTTQPSPSTPPLPSATIQAAPSASLRSSDAGLSATVFSISCPLICYSSSLSSAPADSTQPACPASPAPSLRPASDLYRQPQVDLVSYRPRVLGGALCGDPRNTSCSTVYSSQPGPPSGPV